MRNALLLGNCSRGNDLPNHHPEALAARANQQAHKGIEQGTNLLADKPGTSSAARGQAASADDSATVARPKAKAKNETTR